MGSQHVKGYQDEINILNKFLAAQSVFHIFETTDKIADFSTSVIKLVPGVYYCSFCLLKYEKPFGDFFEASGKLSASLSSLSEYKKDITIQPPSEENLIVFDLQTAKYFLGYVLITVYNKNQFERYRPAVTNLINIVAINLENNLQNDQLKKNQEELEKEVKKRTAELREEVEHHLRLQKALSESEIRYRDLFKNNPNPMWIYDRNTFAFREVNDAAVSHYGYTREEFLSMTIDNIRPQEDVNKNQRFIKGENSSFAQSSGWRHVKKDGTIIDVEISTHSLPRRGNKSERLVLAKDVTRRKRIETELFKSEQRYRELANTVPIGIFETDMNGNVIFSNDTAFDWFGYTVNDLIDGFNFFNCIIESERPRLLENLLTDSVSFSGEYTAKRRNGDTFTVIISAFPLIKEDKICGLRGTVVDISERKKAEQSLEQKNKDLFFLSMLAFELAELPSSENLMEYLMKKLKDYSGATLVASLDYHPGTHSLIISQVNAENKILKRLVRTFGKKAIYTPVPVTRQMYSMMLQEVVTMRNSLNKLSFGAIPEPIDITITHITELNCYCGITIAVSGELLGVFILAFKSGQKPPQKELMVSVGNLAAITLRRYYAEKALKLSEVKQKAMIANISDVIAVTDEQGIIKYESPNVERLLGWSPEELVGKNIFDLINTEDVDPMMKVFSKLLIRKKFAVFSECRYLCKDGSYLWVRNAGINLLENPAIDGILFNYHDITQRKKSEETLHKFRLGIERSPEAIFITDPDGSITYTNPAFKTIYGYSTEEVTGLTPRVLKSGTYSESIYKTFWSTLLSKNPIEREMINKRKDGRLIVIECVNNPILDKDDNIIGFLGIHRDISNRKEREDALRFSEERFKQVAENAEEWIWEVDANGLYTYSSPIVEKILGYKSEEIVGSKHFYDLFPKENRKQLKAVAMGNFKKKQRFEKFINENMSKSGRLVFLETTGAPMLDKSGALIGYRGTDSDVTERIHGEEKLRKLSLAVEQSPASIIITNLKGEIEYVNMRFTQLTGYLYEEVIGKNPSILKSGRTTDEEYQNLWMNITNGKEWRGEFYNRKKNGDFFWESASISPIMNNNGGISHYLCVKEDITEKKEATNYLIDKIIETEERERLRYSNELHDGLGPIISTIKLYFQLLEENSEPDQKKFIFERAGNCIDEAIQTLKEISHNLSPNVVSNFGLIAGIQNFIGRLNETDIFVIDFDYNVDMRYESNVEITFYRIITELINNTFKYANASHIRIILNYSDAESCLKLEYTDNGKGFDLDKVLNKSSGLGLSSIYQRVNALNGKIDIETSVGKGVRVLFELPVLK